MKKFVYHMKKYLYFSIYAAKSELKDEVANSYLNWIWWLLDPLFFMLIYAFIVKVVFKAEEPSFAAFIFIGLTLWNFFNRTILSSVKLIKNNKAIVQKIYVPKYILLLSKCFVNLFKMGVSFLLVFAMIAFYKVPLTLNALYLIPLIITLFMFTFGVGCLLMHYGVFVEDLNNIMNVFMRLMFYMSGVFYSLITRIPAPYNKYLVIYNPSAFFINETRNILLFGTHPTFMAWLGWIVISILACYLGIKTVYKYENSYAKVI